MALVREVAAAIASVPAELLASRLRVLLEANEADTFAHCIVPTLYLRGTDDRIVRDSAWRKMATLRPMTAVRLPGPHLLLQANPAAVWSAIMLFLEESCL